MNPAEVKQALEIVEDAIELSGRELESYLDRGCGENSALRREVLGYLEYNVEQSVLPTGMANGVAPKIDVTTASEARYDLGDEIARGGMGVVLRAFDNNIRRDVAIKVLRKEAEDNPDIVRRFLQEAQIGGQLQHPGIPPVYEIGRLPDGRPFIAMKLVMGVTLAELLEQRQDAADDQPRLLGIFEHICETMAFAHARGVIHRDLKPDNIMVGEFGEVQVMDWGIAKLSGDASPDHTSRPTAASRAGPSEEKGASLEPAKIQTKRVALHTRVGQVLGTPSYMAPEQAIGRADKTTDVFALGGILCTILTGKPPYQASSSTIQLVQATQGAVRESHERLRQCGADRELIQLAIECLDPDISKRPADAEHVKGRITDYFDTVQTRLREAELDAAKSAEAARADRIRRRAILVAGALAALTLLLILGAIVFNLQERARHAEDVARIETAGREEAERNSYWSTMRVAYSEFESERISSSYQLLQKAPERLRHWEWQHLSDQLQPSIWTCEVRDKDVQIAAVIGDGSELAAISETAVWFVDVASREVNARKDHTYGVPMSMSRNGTHVLSVGGDTVYLWELRTGDLVRQFAKVSSEGRSRCSVSSDGTYVAIVAPENPRELHLYRSDTIEPLAVFESGGEAWPCGFGSDGCFVYSSDHGMHFWDVEGGREVRSPLHFPPGRGLICFDRSLIVTYDPRFSPTVWDGDTGKFFSLEENQLVPLGFAGSGTYLVARSNRDTLQFWNTETGKLFREIPALTTETEITYTLLRDRVVSSKRGAASSEIRIWDPLLEDQRVLRGHTNFVYPVAISPNGNFIASGSWDKTVRFWDGETGRELFVLEGHDQFLHDLSMDPRSRRVVSIDIHGGVRLWDSSSGRLLESTLPPGNVTEDYYIKQIEFTPDGASIVCTSRNRLCTWNAKSLELESSIDLEDLFFESEESAGLEDGRVLTLSPSGEHAAMANQVIGGSVMAVWSLHTGTKSQTIRWPGRRLRALSISPDSLEIALGFEDGVVSLRRLADVEDVIWERKVHNREVFALEFHPDGSRLFTGGRDKTIRILETSSGIGIGSLRGHEDYVWSLDISADGKRLVSGSGDKTVRIWETWPYSRRIQAIENAKRAAKSER